MGQPWPLTADYIRLAAEWVKETTLIAGSEVHTAYTVAGLFARGLEDELRRREHEGTLS